PDPDRVGPGQPTRAAPASHPRSRRHRGRPAPVPPSTPYGDAYRAFAVGVAVRHQRGVRALSRTGTAPIRSGARVMAAADRGDLSPAVRPRAVAFAFRGTGRGAGGGRPDGSTGRAARQGKGPTTVTSVGAIGLVLVTSRVIGIYGVRAARSTAAF